MFPPKRPAESPRLSGARVSGPARQKKASDTDAKTPARGGGCHRADDRPGAGGGTERADQPPRAAALPRRPPPLDALGAEGERAGGARQGASERPSPGEAGLPRPRRRHPRRHHEGKRHLCPALGAGTDRQLRRPRLRRPRPADRLLPQRRPQADRLPAGRRLLLRPRPLRQRRRLRRHPATGDDGRRQQDAAVRDEGEAALPRPHGDGAGDRSRPLRRRSRLRPHRGGQGEASGSPAWGRF